MRLTVRATAAGKLTNTAQVIGNSELFNDGNGASVETEVRSGLRVRVGRITASQVELVIEEAEVGKRYGIEASAGLQDWKEIRDGVIDAVSFGIGIPVESGLPWRFYRVVQR